MLKNQSFYQRPGNLVLRGVSAVAIAISGLIGCWSVTAQTQEGTNEQDGAEVKLASHTQPVKPFSQPITKPWEDLGKRSGYFSVNMDRVLEHPDIRAWALDAANYFETELMPDSSKSAEDFGLQLDSIERMDGSLQFRYTPSEGKERESSIHIAGEAVKLVNKSEVDWPALISATDVSPLIGNGTVIKADDFKKLLLQDAKEGRSFTFHFEKLFKKDVQKGSVSPAAQSIWQSVAGGDIGLIHKVSIDTHDAAITKDLESFRKANYALMMDSRIIGYGVEFSPDFMSCQLRIAIAANEGVTLKHLAEEVESFRSAFVKDMEANSDDPKRVIANEISDLKVSIVRSKTPDTSGHVLVEGACTKLFESYLGSAE